MSKTWRAALALVLLAVAAPSVEAQQATSEADELAEPRPIEAVNSVWIDELTWMEVRDAIADGKTTAIIPTGGIEQNGPYLVTGKHNVILRGLCPAIARNLGDALCSPVIKLVPEGSIEERTGHMRFPGTIGLRQETFRRVLDDVASSLRAHGFTDIVLIGDSGGNQDGMEAVARELNERWAGTGATAHHIAEFYAPGWTRTEDYRREALGVAQTRDDGHHDDIDVTLLMMATDPTAVRYDQRVEAGLASINGASITPKGRTVDLGRELLGFRAAFTAEAIREAMSASTDRR